MARCVFTVVCKKRGSKLIATLLSLPCVVFVTGKLEYQAQSPDEAALVGAARNFGFVFKVLCCLQFLFYCYSVLCFRVTWGSIDPGVALGTVYKCRKGLWEFTVAENSSVFFPIQAC